MRRLALIEFTEQLFQTSYGSTWKQAHLDNGYVENGPYHGDFLPAKTVAEENESAGYERLEIK